jgi:hypothetical protein
LIVPVSPFLDWVSSPTATFVNSHVQVSRVFASWGRSQPSGTRSVLVTGASLLIVELVTPVMMYGN